MTGRIINIIKRFIFLPVWLIILTGYFSLNFIGMILLAAKKNRIAQKLIYSNFVQSQKEMILGKPKITKE